MASRTKGALLLALLFCLVSCLSLITGASAGAAKTMNRAEHTVSVTYTCRASLQKKTYNWTSTGSADATTPAQVKVGASVSMKGWQTTVTIPKALVVALQSNGGASVAGKVSVLDLEATDAKPATLNSAGDGLALPPMRMQAKSLTISLPAKPTTAGPWVASKAGTMVFQPGPAILTLTPNKGSSASLQCQAGKATLSTTTVS